MPASPIPDPLGRFTPPVATWFRDVFAEPTDVQVGAWKAISGGENALVVAPTGSGKTLAAFLWAINLLVAGHGAGGDSSGGSSAPGKADRVTP
ncbi:MAG: DEAD/DEAH box helicase, partial [Corynebacterium sp.]|nr:DEAD/DEAH box helicase [Corynebacterium sp.]